MYNHIVQTKEWADIRTKYGTTAVEVDGVFYTKTKIPLTKRYYAYCPRVNPQNINFEKLRLSLKKNKCIALSFDVPNVLKGSPEEPSAIEVFSRECKKSTRSEFAKANYILDLTKSEQELFEQMSSKHRYNTRYAFKKGITIRLAETKADFDVFYDIHKNTAMRQHYFIRPKRYFELIWDELHSKGMCEILIAEYHQKPLAAWMLFITPEVLYYPYGGSLIQHKNLFASNALGWEAIRFGKGRGCKVFDMWGAGDDPEDTKDPYYGFTAFKAKFGATHVKYIDSYDLIISKPMYYIFTVANKIRWFLLKLGIIK